MKNNFTTAVEITDTHVKVVQGMVNRGSGLITFCDIKEIREPSDPEISKIISSLVVSSKIRTGFTIGVIPRRFTILRHIALPSHADNEIEKMVNLQVTKQIPYPKEDVILDHIVLSKETNGYSKVLVIAVHKEVIERYLKIFQEAGLGMQRLTLSSAGILNWYFFEQNMLKEKNLRPTAVINIDSVNSEICFCHQDKLLFSRSINFGARDLSEESAPNFLGEISLTIETYLRENIGEAVGQITLVSSLREVNLLKSRLEAEHKVPVSILTPFHQINQKKDLSIPLLDKMGVSMVVGLGLLLDNSRKLINLMPLEVSDRQEVRVKQQQWFRFLTLFLLLAALVVSVFAIRLYKNSSYLNQLDQKIKEMEPKVNAIKDKMKRLDFIKERMDLGFSVIDVIRELYNLTPLEVSFSVVYLDESGLLNLQGISQTGSAVGVFQRNLSGSSFFKNVSLQYVTKRMIFKGELNDFKITCQILKNKSNTP